MANILILDDECLSRTRLCHALSLGQQHNLIPADNPAACEEHLGNVGSTIDLLILDASTKALAPEFVDLFSDAWPRAKTLVLSHLPQGEYRRICSVLRKPFTDKEFVETVDRLLVNSKP